MKKILYILTLILLFASCERECNDWKNIEEPAIVVGFNTDAVMDRPFNDLHLLFFDEEDMLVRHDYHTDMEEVALEHKLIESGSYTILAVFNTEEGFLDVAQTKSDSLTLPSIELFTFMNQLKTVYTEELYSDMLTGMVSCEVAGGLLQTIITITDQPITEAMTPTTLELVYPNMEFQPFTKSASVPQLRAVVEVFKKDSETRVMRKTLFINDNPRIDLLLEKGEYDVRVWSDYSEHANIDNYYITANTKSIRVRPQVSYTAGSDNKDAYAGTTSINAGESRTQTIELHRPFAKYKIVATDVEKYNELREKDNKLPPIEELQVQIVYENFFPTAYNMVDRILNGSDTGYKYTNTISSLTEQSATLASDYVMVNGKESSVRVSIYLRDKSGEVVTSVNGIVINYKANHITTITGGFLTSGKGGVSVETEWDEDINFYF